MLEQSIRDTYFGVLQDYIARQEEAQLLAAADLGRTLVRANVPPEEIAEIHEEALQRLAQESPNLTLLDAARLISAPLMELLMAYGLAFRAQSAARKRTEERLRLQAAALDAAANAIIITDREGNILWSNPAFARLTGYPTSEIVGQNPRFLKSGKQDQTFYKHLWDTIRAGQVWHNEIINRHKDGSLYTEEMTITPVRDEHGEIRHFIAIKQDVTERKRIEEHARQQDRLASVGQLAAGIAHDFNNILAVIVLYTGLLLHSSEVPTSAKQRLQIIAQQSQRAADLIQQILDFSRRAVLARAPMDLSIQLKELVKLWQQTLPPHIDVSFHYGPDEYRVYADPTRIQQLFMNLAINARDAMPDGGKLHIDLERIQIEAGQDAPQPDMAAGEWLRVTVSDDGIGIPPEMLPHIYEPFFTTKEPGQGTGLGLAQAYGIVKQHEGHVDVQSTVGEGTTFTVYLPALPLAQPDRPAQTTTSLIQGRGETILVVEDNPVMRETLMNGLEVLNYRVLAAANGQEAVTLFARHADTIALVLSNMIMPEKDGPALFRALKQQDPDVKVIMLTGNPRAEELKTLRAQGLQGWLQKPVSLEELGRALARALQPPGGEPYFQ